MAWNARSEELAVEEETLYQRRGTQGKLQPKLCLTAFNPHIADDPKKQQELTTKLHSAYQKLEELKEIWLAQKETQAQQSPDSNQLKAEETQQHLAA